MRRPTTRFVLSVQDSQRVLQLLGAATVPPMRTFAFRRHVTAAALAVLIALALIALAWWH